MASYQYEAIKMSDRSKISGLLNAASEKEAREILREQDLVPTKLKAVTGDAADNKRKPSALQEVIQRVAGLGSKERIAFTRNVGMMIKSGIPLTDSLLYFENYVENKKFKKVVGKIRNDILSGNSLSQALSKHKKIFNDVYISVTRAGERSGELDQTMGRLTELLIRSEKLKMKVIAASVYPCIVVAIVCLVLLIMFTLVIPTFVDIYQQLGIALPAITQFMFFLSKLFKDNWYITFPVIILTIFGMVKYFQSEGGRKVFDSIIIKVPMFGDLINHVEASHFISTFFVSFGAGIPITEALGLSAQTVQHVQIRAAFMRVNNQIQTGQRLGVALANTGYIPDIVLLMLSSGEESGDLDKMLEASFEYLEDEIEHKIEILTSMMEPALLLVVGFIVGFVALSIYLPLFNIYQFL